MKRVLSVLLVVVMLLAMLPLGAVSVSAADYTYDPDAAIAYAKAHWNDGVGLCARFVSDCLKAGGFTKAYSGSVTALVSQLQPYGQTITCSGWSTTTCLTASMFNGTLSKGDIIVWKGPDAGHVLLYSGKTNSKGQILVYAHNAAMNEEPCKPDSNFNTVYAIHIPPTVSTPSITYSTIDTGTYLLKNNGLQQYANVEYGTDANNQNISIGDLGVWEGQVWASMQYEIKPSTTTAGYSIRPLSSGSRMVNVYGDTVASGNNVCIWEDTGHDSQRWQFEKVNGGYVIRNVQNPSCVLDIQNDFNVCVYTYVGAPNQIWSIQNIVTYDANGGTGAPDRQLKNYDESLTLSSTIPTREGYTFLYWYDGKSVLGIYPAGASYTANENVTLYAVWAKNCEHTYDNDCDDTCNECGAIREESGHIYQYDCDSACAMCGETTREANHNCVYVAATFSTCNEEGNVEYWYCTSCNKVWLDVALTKPGSFYMVSMPALGHNYVSAVTTAATCGAAGVKTHTCSACGDSYTESIPATGAHVYDNDGDPSCNGCGAIREVTEIPADAPAFVVEDVKACYGDTFTVAVCTQNNPGITGLRLKVHYDAELLELVSAEEGTFAGVTYGPLTANPFTFTWVDALHPDNTANDVVVLLTFRAKEGTDPVQTVISLTYDAEDVYNDQWEGVWFNTVSGTVSLTSVTPGDANGDGKVNVRDLGLMQQYLNGWEVTVSEAAGDVNADGKFNVRDLGLLQQYLNGWDVELK